MKHSWISRLKAELHPCYCSWVSVTSHFTRSVARNLQQFFFPIWLHHQWITNFSLNLPFPTYPISPSSNPSRYSLGTQKLIRKGNRWANWRPASPLLPLLQFPVLTLSYTAETTSPHCPHSLRIPQFIISKFPSFYSVTLLHSSTLTGHTFQKNSQVAKRPANLLLFL